jgi:putative redox protein
VGGGEPRILAPASAAAGRGLRNDPSVADVGGGESRIVVRPGVPLPTVWQGGAMTDPRRSVSLERLSKARFRATNKRGTTIEVGEGDDAFSPVEMMLTALAACSAIDVDYIVSKRDEPTSFRLRVDANKIRDDGGNHLTDFVVTFDARFEGTEAGRATADVVPRAVQQSHDRLCTVTRTVELGAKVGSVIARLD